MERMQLLEDALELTSKYTSMSPWRPGLVDIMVYYHLICMHENDYDDLPDIEYIWNNTPDEVMQYIIDTSRIFDLEFGLESLDEELRDYLSQNNFILHVDEVTEEELKAHLEKRK